MEIVDRWSWFAKQTLGRQIIQSADSIALNIAEGYGRYFYKENKNFCYYRRGSAKETFAAITKAKKRNLITEEESNQLEQKLIYFFKILNPYIKSIGTQKTMKTTNH